MAAEIHRLEFGYDESGYRVISILFQNPEDVGERVTNMSSTTIKAGEDSYFMEIVESIESDAQNLISYYHGEPYTEQVPVLGDDRRI